MNDCKYPNCEECDKEDCDMDQKNIKAMLKRRKYAQNPEFYRQQQRDYRSRIRANMPHCDDCKNCLFVQKDKHKGYRRLCISDLRLIDQKVSNSPHWCRLRKGAVNSI